MPATIYLNWDGPQGRETVDELTREPAQTPKNFHSYVQSMKREYMLAGMPVYQSNRPCANWRTES